VGAVRANVVGIVGAGRVGAACAAALVTRGSAAAVLLKDRTNVRAGAVANELHYGALLLHPLMEVGAIHYAHLAAADVVILTVGVNERSSAVDRSDPEWRLALLDANVAVYREVSL
jgi:L-lactate dehydrogenase